MPSGLRFLAPLALMAFIFVLSDQSDTGSDLPEWARVAGHFGQYFLLSALWIWALAPGLGRAALPAAVAISVLYAISDEIHQGFVDGRDSDPLDVAVDSLGALAAAALAQARGSASMRATHSRSRG